MVSRSFRCGECDSTVYFCFARRFSWVSSAFGGGIVVFLGIVWPVCMRVCVCVSVLVCEVVHGRGVLLYVVFSCVFLRAFVRCCV